MSEGRQPASYASRKIKASHKFVVVLAIVSIVGFLGIVSRSLFGFDLDAYVEVLFLLVIGVGMIIEGQIKRLGVIKNEGLTPANFTHLITVIVGFIAIVAGIFSLPGIREVFEQWPGFLAVKGVVALIAIVIIIIQTWIVE